MAKMNPYDRRHKANLTMYQKMIEAIYNSAATEAARIAASTRGIDTETPFRFDDYPQTRKRVAELMAKLKSRISVTVVNGIDAEWTLANNKNNELANRVFGDNVGRLSQAAYRRYYSTNDNARQAFQARKVSGMNLSERVWCYAEQFKEEIEMGLDVGLRNGLSADQMSRDLRQYLRHPDKLFRRVRDERGQLHLSKAAAAYHPGRGVYRSSYMNARRLAATETNIAYRTSDHTRWQQMDFVVGIEIVLSNNHTSKGPDGKPRPFHDICDELAGRYPKDFKFTGWHPHCRCHAVSILKTQKEIAEDTRKIMNGEAPDTPSVNEVRDVPPAYRDWIANNSDRLSRATSTPYFLSDNPQYAQGVPPRLLNEQAMSLSTAAINATTPTPITPSKVMSEQQLLGKMSESGYYDDYLSDAKEGRTIQGYMAHLLGKDKLPQIVSDAEFNELASNPDNVTIYRGFRRNEAENIRNYKYGSVYDGRGGVGEGSYFATKKLSEFSETGDFIEAILDTRVAKIGDYDLLEAQWKAEMRDNNARMRELRRASTNRTEKDDYSFRAEAFDDFGRWATAKGYDAIIHHDSRFTEYIIINRTMLRVRK